MRWFVVLVLVACSSSEPAREKPAVKAATKRVPHPAAPGGESNIVRADYIGPEGCRECHEAQYAMWSTSLHRVMNAKVTDAGAVIGDFNGKSLAYRDGMAKFERTPDGYAMTLSSRDSEVRYQVTRTIGHRGLQEYVGIETPVDASTRRTVASGPESRDEVRLPFGWWPRAGGWVPQVAFDPWLDEASFDPYKPVREPWAERCPWCHSTYPFAQRIARSSARAVGHGLEQFFTSAPGTDRLAVAEQVTTGISCESCHLGGRAHATGAPISAVPNAPTTEHFPTTFAEQRKDPRVVNTICAQCHSGPSPRLADGTALRNSSEALDLAVSPCTGIKCTDCHDPHIADSRHDEPRALAACTKCHSQLAAPDAARAHAGHDNVNCLDCHMPKVVMGIDRYVRTHRISSPTTLADASPNACNLCHLDRSFAWTRDELRRGWDVKTTADANDTPAGERWLAQKSPAIRLIATQAYARSPYFADLQPGLRDSLAYVRAWTQFALDEIRARR